MPDVLLRTVRDAGRGLVFWTAGIVLLVVVTVSIYPSIEGNADLTDAVENYPKELTAFFGGELDFASGAGYLNGELYSLMVPLLLLVYGIGAGARAIAGEEEAGTLELLLAHPLRRRRVLLEKLGAAVVLLAGLGVVVFLAVTAVLGRVRPRRRDGGRRGGDPRRRPPRRGVRGAGAPRRRRHRLAGARDRGGGEPRDRVVPPVRPGEPRRRARAGPGRSTPWDWYAGGDQLRNGLDWRGTVLLLASVVVLAGAAIPLFERRDLST